MESKSHGLRAVKLTEIPLEQRLSAARVAVRSLYQEQDGADILAAALFPSDRTYWVRAQAEPELRAA